jgi:HAD superfamily hydrolase (TIGR01509 family)
MDPIAILFDLDGTIIDTEPVCMEALTRVSAGHGLALTEGHIARIVGRAWDAVIAELGAEAGLPAAAWPGMKREVFDLYDALLAEHVPVVPGAPELVRALHGEVRLALVTGSTRHQAETYLGHLGLLSLFEVVLCDGEYAGSKPHPHCYQLGMELLDVAPSRSLVFEDSAAGIAAGRGAGATVVGINHANHFGQDHSHAHHRVQDLRDIDLARIRAWLSGA